MKVAVILETPLLEAFSLIGADFIYSPDSYPSRLDEEIGMIIVTQALEGQLTARYPDKIIVGV